MSVLKCKKGIQNKAAISVAITCRQKFRLDVIQASFQYLVKRSIGASSLHYRL